MQQGTKQGFAERLNELLDEAGAPRKFEGRQVALAGMFGVSQKGARKWLEAEGLPKFETCIEIAKRFGVHTEWLVTGRGEKWIAGRPPENPIDALPSGARQEVLDFLEFKGTKVLDREHSPSYFKLIERMRRNPPPPVDPEK